MSHEEPSEATDGPANLGHVTADRRSFLAAACLGAAGLAGCTGSPESTPSGDDRGSVLRWNDVYVQAVQEFRGGNVAPTRRAAIMNVAVFDAVNAITAARGDDHHEPYEVGEADAPAGGSRPAAAAGAAHQALTELYGGSYEEPLDAALSEARDQDGDVEAGEAWGRTVADRILALRADDGNYEHDIYRPCPDDPSGVGCFRRDWVPARAFVTPWTLDSRDQFRVGPPPAMDSRAYAESWQRTHEVGNDAEERPQEEIDVAGFWRGAPGSPRTPNMWNVIARTVAAREDRSLTENARLFALLNLAMADAGIADSESKYHYGFWRPRTAIHEGDRDGNPDTFLDEDWEPMAVGGSPEYPSGLAAFGGAGARVLGEHFGSDDYAFEFGSDIVTGVTGQDTGVSRSFESFSEALEESKVSRLYLGNHFRFSVDVGADLGDQIASHVLEHYLRPVE